VIPLEWIKEASQRISKLVITTPVIYDPDLDLYLKLENHQKTGSFKLRGAANKTFSLEDWELANGVVACSAGNHGKGVALATQSLGVECTVFVPDDAAIIKVEAMKQMGARVVLVPGGYVEAEKEAIQFSHDMRKTFISPYNDAQVIAGQGTVALELFDHFQEMGTIQNLMVPVGGGGLICGIGAVIDEKRVRPRLIGVQSEASAFAYQVIHTGSQYGVIESASIAEGLAGEIDHESITIPLMKKYIDDVILVSEEQIKEAIRYAWITYGETIEGSAAVGIAARLAGKIQSQSALTVITGGNIQPELFQSIVSDL
jgi:threonine dehydratase